ncbi:GNAT family N-acetyltransferase [Fictibacillus barbaricus]|uniref:Phosphinothricin acetyltransferase n=1 Tax=Fictibacillus barbaricus TaxID=182136 RepID=A0ABU1TXU2_9BACL|nr:N-acetyltransferase family protein [Fictibacillus barbaricus]MDR7072027.1 phosphinothricin acetyltransferase [Fictibacillus barbaricus]
MIHIREAVQHDLPEILEIYNYAIKHLTATFDLNEQTLDERLSWFTKFNEKYPLIVAIEENKVIGYSCLSPFRDKPAYAKSTELSIYMHWNHQGKGIGNKLMKEILHRADTLGYHTVIGGITGGNEGSVYLHKKFGFEFVGCFKEVGFKFNEWQDVHFYQRMLKQ